MGTYRPDDDDMEDENEDSDEGVEARDEGMSTGDITYIHRENKGQGSVHCRGMRTTKERKQQVIL